jgi:hypothetical protein
MCVVEGVKLHGFVGMGFRRGFVGMGFMGFRCGFVVAP